MKLQFFNMGVGSPGVLYTSPGVGHTFLSNQQLLFVSLFSMLSTEKEIK